MPRPKKQTDSSIPLHADILEMSLVGFEAAKLKIETQILAVKKALGAAARSYAKSTAAGSEEEPVKKRRTMSASSRKRIAQAQKKRWKAVRDAATVTVKKGTKGPKLGNS